jgi:hypothetical protein
MHTHGRIGPYYKIPVVTSSIGNGQRRHIGLRAGKMEGNANHVIEATSMAATLLTMNARIIKKRSELHKI